MGKNALKHALLMMALLVPSACAVKTVDCWQLDDPALAEAQKHGQCGDAFARNRQEIVPVGSVVPPQRRKARPPSVLYADDPAPAIVTVDTKRKRKPGTSPALTQSAQDFP
ncbi:hypothetical protein [Azospirillum sp. sgz302134]